MDADVAAWSAHIRLHDASPGDVVQAAERALREAGGTVTRPLRAVLAVPARDGGEAQTRVDTTT